MRKVGYTGPALYSVGTVRMLQLLSLTSYLVDRLVKGVRKNLHEGELSFLVNICFFVIIKTKNEKRSSKTILKYKAICPC